MTAPCPRRGPVDDSVLDEVGVASDLEWHVKQGHIFCGGCGLDDCHRDRCCTEERDLMGVSPSVCGLCPERVRTGQIRQVTP